MRRPTLSPCDGMGATTDRREIAHVPRPLAPLFASTLAAFAVAVALPAQRAPVDPRPPRPLTEPSVWVEGGMLAGLALSVAAGSQVVDSPTAWPSTWPGYGRRVADQVGFLAVEETVRRSTLALTGWRGAREPCGTPPGTPSTGARRDLGTGAIIGCALGRTFVARAGDGTRRPNLPVLGGIVAGTAASLAWRPEGRAGGTSALAFAATRLALSLTGAVASRAVTEFVRSRRAR